MPAAAAASLHRRAINKVLTLRRRAKRGVSKGRGIGASWFETREDALLTMRGEIARYRRSTAMVRLANVSRSAITETK